MHRHRTYQFGRWTWLYILAFCLVWWAVFAISRHHLDGADMVENYAWGMEGQWGNNKHPPLFGWIVAAWFSVFPTTDRAYYLLNELNLGVALVFMALAMERVLPPEKVLAAVVLTSLASHFGPDSGFKYNANTAQLPFIAGFVWSLLHAAEHGRLRWFVAAGVFAAGALLCKYSALILIAVIALTLILQLRPPVKEWTKGLTVTTVTMLLLVAPHVLWSIEHDWPSLHYMHAAHEARDGATGLEAYVIAATGLLMFAAIPLLVWAGSLYRLPVTGLPAKRIPRLGFRILILSVALTWLAAWLQKIDPVSSWFIPSLLFLGWALIDLTPISSDFVRLSHRATAAGALYLVLALIAAPIWEARYRAYPAMPVYALPETLARDVTRYYRQTYGQRMQLAAGTFPLPYVLSFYSPDHPHGLYGLDPAQSPWIDRGTLQTANKIVVCGTLRFDPPTDPGCITTAKDLFGAPDRVRRFEYTVFDPKSKRTGVHGFEVLTWKPQRS